MKKIKFACNLSLLTLFALGQWACEWDPYEHDSDPVRETLELTASASQIALDENDLSATVLTFDWTPARPMPDEYLVSYTTKLDLLNNNFGSSTAIVTSEDDGIFSRSYTSEQINNWANERWKVPVNKTFTHTWGDAYLAAYDFMFSTVYETPFVVDETTTVLPIALTFRPLMARIGMKLALGANETPKYVTFTTDDNVLPTAGTVNADGTFSASALTNSLTVETDRKEFTVGLLPVGVASKMSVHVTTTDGMTYSDKSFQLAGLKRNTHYTMNVPCRTKRFMLTVPDGVNSKYGTDTYKDNGFFQVEPQYDPESIFDGWYLLRSEIKSDKDAAGGDVLKNRNRIQLQAANVSASRKYNGAFVTPPIQCDGTKTVTVSFTAATNTIIANSVEYRIGVTNNGADISENFLRSFDNIQSSQTGTCPWKHSGSVSRTHTFTVANGQRIMMKLYTTCGSSYHLELADFTYTVE